MELQQTQKGLVATEQAHRTAEQERDDLQAVSSFGPKLNQLMEDNHCLENRITQLENGLEEKQMTAETKIAGHSGRLIY